MNAKFCVIKHIDNNRNLCTVRLKSGESISIPTEFLSPVPPADKKQEFIVIAGTHRERKGTLLSIDGELGIVRLEGDSTIIMLKLVEMAIHVTE